MADPWTALPSLAPSVDAGRAHVFTPSQGAPAMREPVYLPERHASRLLTDPAHNVVVLRPEGVVQLPRRQAPAQRLAELQALAARQAERAPLPAHGWRGR